MFNSRFENWMVSKAHFQLVGKKSSEKYGTDFWSRFMSPLKVSVKFAGFTQSCAIEVTVLALKIKNDWLEVLARRKAVMNSQQKQSVLWPCPQEVMWASGRFNPSFKKKILAVPLANKLYKEQ